MSVKDITFQLTSNTTIVSVIQKREKHMSIGFDSSTFRLEHARVPVEAHEGTHPHFLQRHTQEAVKALQQERDRLKEITSKLLGRIADARNIYAAIQHIIENEGVAGPDGLDCADLTNSEKWQLARTIKECLLDGQYRHGRVREVKIQKASGNGTRTIHIESQIDRIVGRSILQIIQPLIDPQFNKNSFGFRPGKDRRHALHAALEQLEEGRTCWVITDLKKAFDHVPVTRLLDVIRKMLPGIDDQTIELIKRVIETSRKRGIRQGSPLSPLMQNLYLHHLLDRVWENRFPDEPLLRTADDILICCRTLERAHEALGHLREILRPTGMHLNPKKTVIRDLRETGTDWLGYDITCRDGESRVRIAESAWTALGKKLEEAHSKTGSPLRALASVCGWLDQLGPCYLQENGCNAYSRVRGMTESLALDEMLDEDEYRRRWQAAYRWWRLLCRSLSSSSGSGGSACQSVFSATRDRRSDGAPQYAPSLLFSGDVPITVHTDGSYDRVTSCGGWATILDFPGIPKPLRGSGGIPRTTNNRAELTAVIKGLEQTPEGASVRIVSDSTYVVRGINEWMAKWKSQGWRAGTKNHNRPLQNLDLWLRLDGLLDSRNVTADWVRGHSGHTLNEECDALAAKAMMSAQPR